MATAEAISVQRGIPMAVGEAHPTINVLLTLAGVPVTGLTSATTGLALAYQLPNSAAVAVTPASLAAITTAWAAGGFKEIDATKFPGLYRVDLPAAVALVAGKVFVSVQTTSATDPAFHATSIDNVALTISRGFADPNTVRTDS